MRRDDSARSTFLRVLRLVAWVGLLAVAGLAALFLIYGLKQPNNNAITEASLAAVTACAVIIAYSAVRAINCIANVVEEM